MDADSLPAGRRAFQPRSGIPAAIWLTLPLGLLTGGLLLIPSLILREGRCAPNCFIEGQPVGGLTMEAALARLRPRYDDPPLTLITPPRAFSMKLSEFGGAPDWQSALAPAFKLGREGGLVHSFRDLVACWRSPQRFDLRYRFDPGRQREALKRLAWTVNRQPRNARLDLVADGLRPVAEATGLRVEVDATASAMARDYSTRNTALSAVVTTIPPRIRLADLRDVDTPLVSFRTWYRAGEGNRSSNIRLCAGRLNGMLLMPGEVFSFNERVGERSAREGFKLAGMFVNGEKVQGFGGGVCQVSSTVFNVARNASLQIVERHPHSLPVPYVPQGGDATVVYPYSDLKFRNTSDSPVLIEARASGGGLTIRLWGRATSAIPRSEQTARYRVVHYPDKKKLQQAAREELGLPPPPAAPPVPEPALPPITDGQVP